MNEHKILSAKRPEVDGGATAPGGHAVMSQAALAALGAEQLVYVKKLNSEDVKRELAGLPADQAESVAVDFDDLYAIHAADGTRMAVVETRQAAEFAARQYDMEPVSVH